MDIFDQLKDPRQFIEVFNSMDFRNYCINRDRNMSHDEYMALKDWPEEKKEQFKTMYEKDNKKDCSTCIYHAHKYILESPCATCIAFRNYIKNEG